MNNSLLTWLKSNEIHFILHTHDAVYTVAQAKSLTSHIPGLHCKNLFLKYSKGNRYFLVTLPAHKEIKLLELSKLLGVKKLSFAKESALMEILQLEPGSVSPLGLINDKNNLVSFIVDKKVWDSELVCFHPNINTETLELSKENFHKIISLTGNNFSIIDL